MEKRIAASYTSANRYSWVQTFGTRITQLLASNILVKFSELGRKSALQNLL